MSQTEMLAIETSTRKALEILPIGQQIHISSDSQAALKILVSSKTFSKLAWDRLKNLRILAKHNKLTSVLMPGNNGCATIFTEPEPDLALTKIAIFRELNYKT